MRGVGIVCLAVVAGCHMVFPIDPGPDANPAVDDVDGDGVFGAADNCPLIRNPGQEDTDADGPDGVGDACDTCARFNPRQADEDSDGVADACDNCVGIPNLDQSDGGDSAGPDGIGDACDPGPESDLEIARYFVEGGATGTDWIPVVGTWVPGEDGLRLDDAVTDAYAQLATDLTPYSTVQIEIGFYIRTVVAGETFSLGGINDGTSLEDSHRCVLRGPSASPELALVDRAAGTDTVQALAFSAQTLADDHFARVIQWYGNGSPPWCAEPPTWIIGPGPAYLGRVVGLYADGVSIEVTYVVIYAK